MTRHSCAMRYPEKFAPTRASRLSARRATEKRASKKHLELQPDVITLDVEMPVQGGLDALQQLAAKSSAAVIMVSSATEAGAKDDARSFIAWRNRTSFRRSRRKSLLHEKLIAAVSVRCACLKTVAQQQVQSRQAKAIALPKGFAAKAIVIGSSTGGPQALAQLLTDSRSSLDQRRSLSPNICPSPSRLLSPGAFGCRAATTSSKRRTAMQSQMGLSYIAPGGLQMRASEGVLSVCRDAGDEHLSTERRRSDGECYRGL